MATNATQRKTVRRSAPQPISAARTIAVVVLLLLFASIMAAYTMIALNEDIYPFDLGDNIIFLWVAIVPVYIMIWGFMIAAVVRAVSVRTFAEVGIIGILAISAMKLVWAIIERDDYWYYWYPLLAGTLVTLGLVIYASVKNVRFQ